MELLSLHYPNNEEREEEVGSTKKKGKGGGGGRPMDEGQLKNAKPGGLVGILSTLASGKKVGKADCGTERGWRMEGGKRRESTAKNAGKRKRKIGRKGGPS